MYHRFITAAITIALAATPAAHATAQDFGSGTPAAAAGNHAGTYIDPDQWEAEHAKPYPGEPAEFFKVGKAVIKGKINGYDPDRNYNLVRFHPTHPIIGEQKPMSVPIDAEGNFEITIPMVCPGYLWTEGLPNLYLEPDRTLDLLIDESAYRIPEYKEEHPGSKADIRFGGELSTINRELYLAPEIRFGYNYRLADKPASEILDMEEGWDAERKAAIKAYKSEHRLNQLTEKLLDIEVEAMALSELLEHEFNVNDHSSVDWAMLPANYFDRLKKIFAHNDEWAIVNTCSGLLNRLGHCLAFNKPGFGKGTDIAQTDGVFTAQKEEEKQTDSAVSFRHPMYLEDNKRTAIIKEFAGTDKAPFLWQMAMVQTVNAPLKSVTPDQMKYHTEQRLENDMREKGIDIPFLQEYTRNYRNMVFNRLPYPLPDDKVLDVVREVMQRHKGKYIMLDIWGITCGPCIGEIESSAEFRKVNLHNPDFKFVFITGESVSPEKRYNEFVARQLEGEECIYLSASDYARLREVFQTDAIPTYILIDPEGNVVNDRSLSLFSIVNELQPRGIEISTEGFTVIDRP